MSEGRAVRMNLALVLDWLVSLTGSERTVLAMHEIWPSAPIITSAYDPAAVPAYAGVDVRTLWVDALPGARTRHQLFTIPRALAFRACNLARYDVVVTSSNAEAKYVRTGSDTVHVCYCHTPVRYYWSDYDWYRANPPFGRLNWLARLLFPALVGPMRRLDYRAAQRVDYFVANSENVRRRIAMYYDRPSVVINPPIDTQRFSRPRDVHDFFLVAGRQVAYKRLDLAVDAFNDLGLPLLVAGRGEEIDAQRRRAKANVRFESNVSDERMAELLSQARALVFAPEEDFGMLPVEAAAAGCPVIAFGAGGALETVVDEQTGLLFPEQTARSLIDAIRRFDRATLDESAMRRHAAAFDKAVFQAKFKLFVEECYSTGRAR